MGTIYIDPSEFYAAQFGDQPVLSETKAGHTVLDSINVEGAAMAAYYFHGGLGCEKSTITLEDCKKVVWYMDQHGSNVAQTQSFAEVLQEARQAIKNYWRKP